MSSHHHHQQQQQQQQQPPQRMRPLRSVDGNIKGLIDSQSIHSQVQVSSNHRIRRALQMHSSMVQRLALDTSMEGHQGCVNALAWNTEGSMLLSGSDDTKVNVWDYSSRKLLHTVDSGHSANIFCVKFVPETCNDIVASGAGDSEVRIHRLNHSTGGNSSLHFHCHTRRVKKLAVEEGNPHVIWSASEDGTLRQYDLREDITCPQNGTGSADHECRNVLLDLRSAAKRSLSDLPSYSLGLKTCAINRTRPHQLLVGGSDAFARLYDRRFLPPPSSSRTQRKASPCVCYLCPAHLSEYNRPSLHLTHVTFSPNGSEVLLSYSGEHVYLMDVNLGKDDTVMYAASDLPKQNVLEPVVNGVQCTPTKVNMSRQKSPQVSECQELLNEARKAVMEYQNYHYAIEIACEVLDSGDSIINSDLQLAFLCIRAGAFLKRQWKNDVHMAVRDCNRARALDPMSAEAHSIMAEAFSLLGKHAEALDYVTRAQQLDPSNEKISEDVISLRAKLDAAEEARRNSDGGKKDAGGQAASVHSSSDHVSPEGRVLEREGDDFDDDMEMEMEIEVLVGDEDERERDIGFQQGSSLNLRLRRRANNDRDKSIKLQPPSSGTSSDAEFSELPELALDMRQRYVGHCNVGTDIKQANFLGERGDYVASGSDDGRWFIWHKRTGRLMKLLKGDENGTI